jgi:diadenosine tetraphosphate (Ap4A) HIT family hydrolase
MSKAKILLVGSVGEHVGVLHAKLESLQSSKAGPFDACFCVGDIQLSSGDKAGFLSDRSFPLPVYVQEFSGDPLEANPSSTPSSSVSGTSTSTTTGSRIVPLGGNLFYLQGDKAERNKAVQLIEIKLPNCETEIVVGCCSKHIRLDSDSSSSSTAINTNTAAAAADADADADGAPKQQQQQQQQHRRQQCDFLLSSDWPQGMEDVVNVDTEPLSFDVAQVVLQCRPRYHVAPSSQHYHQSPPYALPHSEHVGRFIALAPVIPGKTSKSTKFIHALGLTPLSANPPSATAPSTLPCPFLPPSNNNNNHNSSAPSTITHPTKNIPGFVAAARAGDTGSYSRFATTTRKRNRDNDSSEPVSLEPPEGDPTIKTLFLYGLHKDVTGELQSTANTDNDKHRVFQAFAKHGLTQVRYPPNSNTSTYCFLEFPDQKTALACLLDCQGHTTIDSVALTLKWATPNNNNNKRSRHHGDADQQQQRQHFVTQAEAPDSTTLYFHPPKDTENSDDFSNALCEYLQQTLEEALNEGNTDDNERITAETEPALKVSVRRPHKDHQYGFLEFASHAAATMALAAVTESTDGGLVKEAAAPSVSADGSNTKTPQQPSHLIGVTLRWAKGEPPKTKRQELLEALGLERHFFAADTRTDCWFCLASPTCETHLITGVYKEWYAAMPKGPVHPGHVLLVPVTHTRQGAWTLKSSTPEWTELLNRLADHASQAYDCDLFIFERAMETKGGYHSHVNCVPIPRIDDTAMQLQTTMMAHAKASGFELRPIQSDLGIEALMKMNGDNNNEEDSQYFYAEIRTRRQSYRFLYQHNDDKDHVDDGSRRRSVVPLQFAREVLAAVLKNPKLAHWKSCVVDKEQEAQLATDFRESFTKMMSTSTNEN